MTAWFGCKWRGAGSPHCCLITHRQFTALRRSHSNTFSLPRSEHLEGFLSRLPAVPGRSSRPV